jgi:SAM-dependent methyltransferase
MEKPVDTEQRTRAWLEERIEGTLVAPPGPGEFVYDDAGNPRRLSRYHFENLQRKLKIFRRLDRLDFASFIDVGSGWDYYPHLVRARYGADAYYSDMVHSVNLPLEDPRYAKLDHAVTLELTRLPFRDDSFDVVLSSEVLEHLVRPIEAIAELLRITRKYLIMTSLEALSPSRPRRFLSNLRIDTRIPHVERNFFLREELEAVFGPGLRHECLLHTRTSPVSHFETVEAQAAAFASLHDRRRLAEALCRSVSVADHDRQSMGILLVAAKDGGSPPAPDPRADHDLADWLVGEAAARERSTWTSLAIGEVLRTRPELRPEGIVPERPVADSLLGLLQCPDCRATFERVNSGLRCAGCGRPVASDYGVPILRPTAFDETVAAGEALARLCGSDERRRRTVSRLMRRLRRREKPPSPLRRAFWKLVPPA